jgi:hypothetical protein
MEKDLKRVYRWIDRCMEACRSKKWNSALAEVECARAELDSARESIWELAAGEKKQFPVGQAFALSFRSLAVALLVVMVAALPISTGGYAPVGVEQARSLRLEWVTSDEQSVLSSLRKSLSEMNLAREDSPGEGFPPSRPLVFTQPVETESSHKTAGNEVSPALEEVLTLLEIGQRVLRGSGIVVQGAEE